MSLHESRRRRSIRLRDFDYSEPGAYFVTICTSKRTCLFGEIVDGQMSLSTYGKIAQEEWQESAVLRAELRLDEFVIMPNHVHGIVHIEHGPAEKDERVGAHGRAPLRRRQRSLGSFIAGLKAASARRINEARGSPGAPVWQRNYYEHVVRSERDLKRIREYVRFNPMRWDTDEDNPSRTGDDPGRNEATP